MNSFFLCIDSNLSAPQAEQHLLSKNFASKIGGKIVFYGAEEYLVLKNQSFILQKLIKTPNLDGVIFFTINQFCYNNSFNIKLLENILKNNFSVHFTRESFSINNYKDLSKKLIAIYSYYYCNKKNNIKSFARNLLKS